MRFFLKFTFICNVCFIASVILRMLEKSGNKKGMADAVIPLPWAQNVLVTLGYSAIIINMVFVLIFIVLLIARKTAGLANWIVISNLLLFIFQLIYFFTNTFN